MTLFARVGLAIQVVNPGMFRMDAVDNKVATTYDMQESYKYHIFCSK
jgi:hypothetical protein